MVKLFVQSLFIIISIVEIWRKLKSTDFIWRRKSVGIISGVCWKSIFHPLGFFQLYNLWHLSVGSYRNSLHSVDLVSEPDNFQSWVLSWKVISHCYWEMDGEEKENNPKII